jgi:hypothetical protein
MTVLEKDSFFKRQNLTLRLAVVVVLVVVVALPLEESSCLVEDRTSTVMVEDAEASSCSQLLGCWLSVISKNMVERCLRNMGMMDGWMDGWMDGCLLVVGEEIICGDIKSKRYALQRRPLFCH